MSTCVLCNARVHRRTALVWRKDGYDILRCPSCGLVFRADPPEEQALSGIYDEGYFHDQPDRDDRHGYADYLRDAALHRANAQRRLRMLAAYARPGRLLDVGAAAGFFVDEARRAGWEASGVDVSPSMVEWATSQLGVPVACSTFTKAEIEPPLDAITMWDYIEHSIDPRRDLEKAQTVLRPRGTVALSTGDVGSLAARASGRRWHLLTPEHHNFFFDRTTLRRLLEETGFSVLDMRYRAGLYSLAHVLYKLSARGAAARRLAKTRIGRTGIPINLYDVLTVVAERR